MSRCHRKRRPRRVYLVALAVLLEALPVLLRAHRLGGNVVVRCRRGHLFTTLWIPGISLKSLRLGFWRVEHCPVGHHWSAVTLVRHGELSAEEQRVAHQRRGIRIP